MKVFVYWNLRRDMWSVKALEGPYRGKVIMRVREVLLKDADGKVSEAGRQRVLREGRKNVHAGIVGTLVMRNDFITSELKRIGDRITYNPYKTDRFIHSIDGSAFEGSYFALMTYGRDVYV